MVNLCNRIIEYCFYALFLLVPLVFTSWTSELFELNKMWLTWILTIIIAASWFIKMVLQRKFFIQKTPLDIPIGLFLLSQIISTIFSLDFHVSLWGYYSRFNGGLLSIISYIFLYYAFLSNFTSESLVGMVKRLLFLSLISGLVVGLWGLPSHFGHDPTCLLFRGNFDVSCWTADFMPKVRIFSTLGQPDWLAAYLAILIPISIIMFIKFIKSLPLSILYLLLSVLFYIDLLYSQARSGILGIWITLVFFFSTYLWLKRKNLKSLIVNRSSLIIIAILLFITFVIGTPINQLRMFTLEGLKNSFQKPKVEKMQKSPTFTQNQPSAGSLDTGGTESGHIRLLVWEGAINAWKANPLFGTGVETFAFAYYKYKPVAHNLTSEWNFLYNKAHNEYLNYLATTGIFGLGSYLLMISYFLFRVIPNLFRDLKSSKTEMLKPASPAGEQVQHDNDKTLILALLAGYLSILITNFFGFSVVMINVYLFMIPAFVFVLNDTIKTASVPSTQKSAEIETSIYQWTPIVFIFLIGLFMIWNLFNFWRADIAYSLGYNLDRAGEYQQAFESLHKAVKLRGDEPVFKDELSINDAIIAISFIAQKDQSKKEQAVSIASSLAQEAINTSNEVISQYTNNVIFWKTRTKLFYTLSQADTRYLPRALDSIQKANALAPNDANIWYNLGVIYGQNNNIQKGIEALEKTVKLKPDYRDAYYALGLFYHTQGNNEKAISEMQYILDHISPQDSGATESIKSWGK